MYNKIIRFIWFSLFSLSSAAVIAQENNDYKLFENIFLKWTQAFNNKDLAGACNLFAKDMVAEYQGASPRNYDTVCNGFKKIFNENQSYKYSFKLQKVYRSKDLASIRITWYLQVIEDGKIISNTQDEGIDILKLGDDGSWKIVNYLAYPKN